MSGLLDGMKVLDAGIWRPVPHATQLLADLGAEVLKLEPPGGDPMRQFPEIFEGVAGHKRSVVLDLRTDDGRARALDLAAHADVFAEGWRPGVADRLGLGYERVRGVNPPIVYCSVSGYGQTGPWRDRPGHDLAYQALAGLLAPRHVDDAEPTIPRLPVADLAGGTVAALLICAAWARRLQTGEGERIDVAMADVLASWAGPRATAAVRGRDEPVRGSAGYGIFGTADGRYVALAVISEQHFWDAVCDALGLDALHGLPYAERLDRVEECNAAVGAVIARLRRDDAVDRLTATGAPVAPVLTPEEAAEHPQFRQRGVFVDGGPGVPLRPGFPAVLADHPPRSPGPVPEQDAHDGFGQ